jgi:peroxiredoxin
MIHPLLKLAAVFCIALSGCQHRPAPSAAPNPPPPVPQRAEDVRPLQPGARAPAAQLHRVDGDPVDMASLYRQKPTMLIFYRGGWCPYCNVHLGHLAEVEPKLVELGYQVLAVSPDRPGALRESMEKGDFGYTLLSDSEMALAQAFGVAFRVDDATVEQYRGFGIDLARASGRGHHLLPVPAVYIIDTGGVIRFAHWDEDYQKRLEPAELLAAAREAAGTR